MRDEAGPVDGGVRGGSVDAGAPVLQRLRGSGRDPRPFRQAEVRVWVAVSLGALALTALLPFVAPASVPWLSRTTPLLSLFFFLSAVGHWLRMRHRAFPVAATITMLLYALTAWAPAAFELEDFFIVALLSSFLVFALAGFNLVFILEEAVFDIQRLTHLRHPAWRFAPTLVVASLAWSLPLWERSGGPDLPALWIASLVNLLLLGGWWFVRAFNTVREGPVLKELHLVVASTLAMAAVLDAIGQVGRGAFIDSLLAYGVLVGTWLYVSYTTLQRTYFLLRAQNALPWLLFLLSASFALLQHAQLHYSVERTLGVTVLLEQRLAYLLVGIGIGMAVYVVQAVWRLMRSLRDDRRLDPRGRIVAGRVARLAEGLFGAEERLLRGTTYSVYAGVESLLPGEHHAPRERGWELDPDTGDLRRFDEGEEE